MGRAVVAVTAALLLAVVVVRNAVVAEYADIRPDRAMAAWRHHPTAELWSGLTEIAAAARAGRPVGASTLLDMNDVARKAPLAAEPFLVRGIQARLAGDESLAARAFEAAQLRDGRSVPARYFLADHYLRVGDAEKGLPEVAMLAHMIPNGVSALSPYVATYAKDPRNWKQLKTLFRSDKQLEEGSLSTLATDPQNSDIVLNLASARPAGEEHVWTGTLLNTLVNAGEYPKAYDAWRSLVRLKSPEGLPLYDAGFEDAEAPPPFNWTLTSSSLGLAERQKGGRLHIVYYAQDNGTLATQLLLLKPGRYWLAMQATGDLRNARLLSWTVTCVNSKRELVALRLVAQSRASFDVPGNCPAQRIDLIGSAPDLTQTVDVTISALTLTRSPTGA